MIPCYVQHSLIPQASKRNTTSKDPFNSIYSFQNKQPLSKFYFTEFHRMLNLAIQYGKVFIITNAAEGWVEFSAARYMPSLMPILEKIPIISARSRYEQHFPNDFTKWKLYAFLET